MNRIHTAAAICLVLSCAAGCDDKTSTNDNTSTGSNPRAPSNPSSTTPRATTPITPPAPDNTANNKRDRETSATTPMDQSNDKTDLDITARIRSAIIADMGMSTNAQNCKIITQKGVVTLRGVVNSDSEKQAIETLARNTAGVTSVDNQLEVSPPK